MVKLRIKELVYQFIEKALNEYMRCMDKENVDWTLNAPNKAILGDFIKHLKRQLPITPIYETF